MMNKLNKLANISEHVLLCILKDKVLLLVHWAFCSVYLNARAPGRYRNLSNLFERSEDDDLAE